ncbi:helix-turn-helix transcriptional regulator [Jiangella mangrovi]|uniref:Putative ATPase/DNA-binding CsgD family transcriptional regulator n=1 Tax=Jiangella mangrovi TaxID=1524084 RepID=A0A7W9LPC9_9ACTN|nr:LuxR C-terminal-related transcriptional regulator [Jiangella mangrovi]MBB5791144.1 putative ATPase/DNA-binding CsgD family transcriptional regulator [Jiangella mangrovi]
MTDQATARPSAGRGLPRPATSFVGRADEVRAVTGLLGSHRLVTLAGPGGAGKTRLAIEAARTLTPSFPDGVWWVELAGLTDGSAVAGAAAEVTGALVDPRRGPVASLSAHLAGRRALLCLDNAEHLGDEVASVAEAVVQAGPEVTVLVTSREPLRLAGEQVWRVPPLGDDEAVTLFVERGALVRPSYRPDPSGAEAIRAIVRHLDGIPLALELAAAWLGTLSAEQILAGLDDRFRLLVRGPRNAQRRQRTLAASIGWSHALLDEVDRALLRRLSVFAGPFPLDAATSVGCGSPVPDGEELTALARLVDASLVMTEEHAGQVRYRLLETIRAFAGARLGETDEDAVVRGRHLRYYAGLTEAADAWREADPDRWQSTLQGEYADLRAALDWALSDGGAPDTGRRLAASMAWLWHLDRRGIEGVEYLRRAIGVAPDERSIVQARLLTGLALVLDTAAPLDLEYDAATRALELATELGDDDLRALCLDLAAVGACYTDFDQAWELAEQAAAAAAAARADDGLAATSSRAVQALVLHHRDRHAEANAVFDDIVPALVRQHRGIAATMLGFQATGALATGDVDRAQGLAAEGLTVALPLGDILRVGMARAVQAVVHIRAGDPDAADAVLDPVLRLAGEDEVFVTGLPYALGLLAVSRDDPAAAAGWYRRGAAASDRGVDSWIAAQSLAELGAVLATAGDAESAAAAKVALDRAVATAARLGMPRVLAVARLAQAELAVAGADGTPHAVELVHEALTLQVEHGLRAGLPDTLEALARHGSAIRPTPDDVRVLGAADAARSSLGLPRPPGRHRQFVTTLAGLRTALGADAVATAWDEGARLALDEAAGFVRRARGSRGRPASGWASLTPTELQVVALVADGCSNPEIAARLLMGRGTVKTHLAHIFGKLDVANRTELASLASARGRD